jgi:hypothetical protein
MTDASCLCLIGLGNLLGMLSWRMSLVGRISDDSKANVLLSADELISQ